MTQQWCMRKAISGVALALAVSSASAAFIDIVEPLVHGDPIVVTTNLHSSVLGALSIVVTNETAVVVGSHTPQISPFPVDVGVRVAGLLEPTNPDIVSDVVILTADPVFANRFGTFQQLTIEFFSDDRLLQDVLNAFPGTGLASFIIEDGTLQDISALLGSLPEGLIVRVLSRVEAQEAPAPATLLLLAGGLAALGLRRRKVT